MRFWLMIGITLFAPDWASAQEGIGQFLVDQTVGTEVWVHRGGGEAKEAVTKGTQLKPDDVVVTGDSSHAVIELLDGSKVSIGPFSRYQILRPENSRGFWQWSFRLIIGTVRALVRKVTDDHGLSRFKVHTEMGTAGVRGTDFVVSFNDGSARMDVYTIDGSVFIGPPGAEAKDATVATVDKNRSRSIGKDGKPTKAKAFVREEFMKTLDARGFPKLELGKDRTLSVGGGAAGAGVAPVAAPVAAKKKAGGKEDLGAAASTLSQKLYEAAASGNAGAVKTFLRAGADPNAANASGTTALMAAAKGKHTLCMKSLLDGGANPNMQDKRGHTALVYAVRWGDLEGVVLMRAANANLDLKSTDGLNAEEFARRRGEKDIVSFLRAWRTEVETENKAGRKSARTQ